jgi:GntR family transcriptional regulator
MRTTCNSTHVIPFRVPFRAGVPIFEQVVYAAKKAIISGQLRSGDAFPSIRSLSRELKINPNTAHKIVAHLINEGLLQTYPGIGTVVATLPEATRENLKQRTHLLGHQIEQLVVEARRLGVELDDLLDSLATHWRRLSIQPDGVRKPK